MEMPWSAWACVFECDVIGQWPHCWETRLNWKTGAGSTGTGSLATALRTMVGMWSTVMSLDGVDWAGSWAPRF